MEKKSFAGVFVFHNELIFVCEMNIAKTKVNSDSGYA